MTILKVDLDLDTELAEKDAKKKLTKAGQTAGKSFSIGFGSAIKVGATLVALQAIRGAVSAFTGEIGKSVQASKSLEVFRTQFATILGGAKAAQKQLASLQKFAATTPFQLPGLATATRQLLSFGVEQEKVIPTLRQIGELAAGTGTAIEDLTIPYGRLISTQKLTLVELDKFSDRGVNLYAELAKQTGVSLGQIRDDISKGKVDFEEFTTALKNLTSEGGTFFGATVSQSKTLEGLISTLSDNIFNLRASFGDAIKPILKSITIDLIGAVQKLNEEFSKRGPDIVNKIFDIARSATFLVKPFRIAFNFIKVGFQSLETGISAVVAGLGTIIQKGLQKPLEIAASFPGQIGLNARSTLDKINLFAKASQETLVENANATKESLINIFETGEVDAQLRAAIERYRAAGLESAEIFKRIVADAKDTAKTTASEINQIGKTFNNTLGNQIASGIETISKALVAGENVFKAFGQAALGLVADFAIQAGKIFVATGIAQLALFKTPAASILAGAALIAAGTVAKSFFGGGSGGDAGSAAGVSSGPLPTQPEFSAPEPEERLDPETRVSINIQGDVLDSDETGLRIARILEDASLNENIRITGGIA